MCTQTHSVTGYVCLLVPRGAFTSSPPGRLSCWQSRLAWRGGFSFSLALARVHRDAGWISNGSGSGEVVPIGCKHLAAFCLCASLWEVLCWTLLADPRRWPSHCPALADLWSYLFGAIGGHCE